MDKKMKIIRYRDAETGEYVSKAYAVANPATTVRESDYVKTSNQSSHESKNDLQA